MACLLGTAFAKPTSSAPKPISAISLEMTGVAGSKPTKMKETAGGEFELDCDLCLLAMGFVSPEHPGPIDHRCRHR